MDLDASVMLFDGSGKPITSSSRTTLEGSITQSRNVSPAHARKQNTSMMIATGKISVDEGSATLPYFHDSRGSLCVGAGRARCFSFLRLETDEYSISMDSIAHSNPENEL